MTMGIVGFFLFISFIFACLIFLSALCNIKFIYAEFVKKGNVRKSLNYTNQGVNSENIGLKFCLKNREQLQRGHKSYYNHYRPNVIYEKKLRRKPIIESEKYSDDYESDCPCAPSGGGPYPM